MAEHEKKLWRDFSLLSIFFRKRKKKLEYCRLLWNGKVKKDRDLGLISLYHQFEVEINGNGVIDNRTWQDLDMNSVYSLLDTTASKPGQQFLYHWLKRISPKDEKIIAQKYQDYKRISEAYKTREKIQFLLGDLTNENAYYLPYLFFEPMPKKPKWFPLLIISAVVVLFSILLSFFYKVFIFTALIFGAINGFIHIYFDRRIFEYLSPVSHLFKMLKIAKKIYRCKKSLPLPEIDILGENLNVVGKLARIERQLVHDPTASDDLQRVFFFYINMICLLDIFLFYRTIKKIYQNRQKLLEIFKALGAIDATIAVSSYLQRINYFCIPTFESNRKIVFTEVSHPLLTEPVANSIDIENKSVIITGSNMAGKTTFIKTLGVNMILAQTIGVCLARKVTIPKLMVKTMMERKEDLGKGKSYYFVEVEQIKDLIEIGNASNKYLFLIDEVFRGTNTVERIAASKAILEYLASANTVFATTHDIELQEMLVGSFVMVHFSEKIINNKYTFDYELKEGYCKSRNAIRLLELSGYPQEIIKNALQTAIIIES